MSAEQAARDMLARLGYEDAQTRTAGDLVELANLIAGVQPAPAAPAGSHWVESQRIGLAHRCGSAVVHVRRTVVTMPEDAAWPKDVTAVLPWCESCKAVVDLTDVIVTVGGK
jgi:hypothetical protein